MSKKLIIACLAVFALAAFAFPALASAANSPEVTHPTGTRLATGKLIDAHNVGNITLVSPSNGEVLTTCTSSTFTGELTKNDGSNVEGNIEASTFTGTGASGACTGIFGNFTVDTNIGTNGTPWCMRSTSTMNEDEFQIRGGKCSVEAHAITFVLTGPGFNCRYSRTNALVGTGTTDTTGDAIVSFAAGTGTEFTTEATSGILCPSAGRLVGSWTLQTNTVSTEPLYIS